MSEIQLKVAAKAIITNDNGEVLLLRESAAHSTNTNAGRYQLPGGRIRPGEVFMDALRREVLEETGLRIEAGRPLFVGEWRPVVRGEQWHIVGIFLPGRAIGDAAVRLSEEHNEFLWIRPEHRGQYDIIDPEWQAIDAHVESLPQERL